MMDEMILEGNQELPSVVLDATLGRFEIEGKALSENCGTLFTDVISWLEEYSKAPNAVTRFQFKLDYFNITSSKRILNILFVLEEMAKSGYDVAIDWWYHNNDDKMYEVGHDFATMVNLPFNFNEIRSVELEPALG